jgi:hypothetical protein
MVILSKKANYLLTTYNFTHTMQENTQAVVDVAK